MEQLRVPPGGDRLSREELKETLWYDRFAEIDTDRNGMIDRREFEAFLWRESGKRHPPRKSNAATARTSPPAGMVKVGRLMVQFFKTDSTSRPWFAAAK